MIENDQPYICTTAGCKQRRRFNRKADLERHQREVHNHQGDRKDLLCSDPACKRSFVGKGFPRKEYLADHLKRVHNIAKTDAGSSTDDQNSKSSAFSLLSSEVHVPIAQSSRSQPAPFSPMPRSPPKEHRQARQKRGRPDEGDDEDDEVLQQLGLDEPPNTEIKRLKHIIKDQKHTIKDQDRQLAEKDAQVSMLLRLVEQAMKGGSS